MYPCSEFVLDFFEEVLTACIAQGKHIGRY